MPSDLATVSQQVQAGLHQLDEAQLLGIAQKLSISSDDETKVRGRGRMGVLRWVVRYLAREEVEDLEDGGLSILEGILSSIEELVGGTKKEEPSTPQQDEDGTTPEKDAKPPSPTTLPATTPDQVTLSVLTNLMKRDFKISGQIGEPGQRDRITYTSLMRQLDAAQAKGYTDRELVEAVIRAISPGMRLRSYLESSENLTLTTVKDILEVHFKEGDATTLYKELSSASQGSNESCQEFVMRMLDLRQKIILASKRVDAQFRYDPALVQKMFLHSLSTGIGNDSIRLEVRLLLQDPSVSDEALLKCVKDADGQEAERRGKQKSKAKVNKVEENSCELTDQIKQLQADLAALKAQKEAPPAQQQQTRRPNRERGADWGCAACREAGRGPECRHCFHCGSEDHFLRGCRLRYRQTNLSGNAQGSPKWDGGRPLGPSPRMGPQDQ